MGKASRAKKNRSTAPYSRSSVWSYLLFLDRSTILFVAGVLVFSYGTSALQYSRWNHSENAHVNPVFHPWAIIVGVVLTVASYKIKK